ncbi:hypothetical protein TNCT_647771 [Trichonephila clavata]|uniref:Uncharacterized protein n=1 Tax=Trichonephila clavata TaxID=2740835 RepID=A0A8X6F8H9_TRICU|nr:hypothetical protein TNCT_647771 [Trichonephila clavata]
MVFERTFPRYFYKFFILFTALHWNGSKSHTMTILMQWTSSLIKEMKSQGDFKCHSLLIVCLLASVFLIKILGCLDSKRYQQTYYIHHHSWENFDLNVLSETSRCLGDTTIP